MNSDQTLANIESAGIAPFFNAVTYGVDIHIEILELAPSIQVVKKSFAAGFHQTDLEQILDSLAITELIIGGMMTQDCVTHTAISKTAEKYTVRLLPDCCTSMNEPIHLFALHAISTRVSFIPIALIEQG